MPRPLTWLRRAALSEALNASQVLRFTMVPGAAWQPWMQGHVGSYDLSLAFAAPTCLLSGVVAKLPLSRAIWLLTAAYLLGPKLPAHAYFQSVAHVQFSVPCTHHALELAPRTGGTNPACVGTAPTKTTRLSCSATAQISALQIYMSAVRSDLCV